MKNAKIKFILRVILVSVIKTFEIVLGLNHNQKKSNEIK